MRAFRPRAASLVIPAAEAVQPPHLFSPRSPHSPNTPITQTVNLIRSREFCTSSSKPSPPVSKYSLFPGETQNAPYSFEVVRETGILRLEDWKSHQDRLTVLFTHIIGMPNLLTSIQAIEFTGIREAPPWDLLRQFPLLKKITLNSAHLSSLRGVEALAEKLEEIALNNCVHLSDVSSLKRMHKLKKTEISGNCFMILTFPRLNCEMSLLGCPYAVISG